VEKNSLQGEHGQGLAVQDEWEATFICLSFPARFCV
jgi:hypothetical protein